MSYRDVDPTLGGRLAEMDRQIRRLEARVGELERQVSQPDPGWELRQVGTDLQYLYVPSGVYGPVIGSQ